MKGGSLGTREGDTFYRISGLYIHIPFCFSKCRYCSFYSLVIPSEDVLSFYSSLVVSELRVWRHVVRYPFTLYLGGGTPTSLGWRLVKLVDNLLSELPCEPVEFTVEANPATFNRELLKCLRRLGVDRLSVGVQSLEDRVLKTLGRAHSAEDAVRALDIALEVFDNVNADIIFAVPGQSLSSIERTLKTLIDIGVKHISAYGLSLEEGTELWRMREEGKIEEISEEVWREMFFLVHDILEDSGFEHYEVSNYARKGYKCLHNMVYWFCREYVGIGPSASGFVGKVRYTYCRDLYRWVNRGFSEYRVLSERDMFNEKIMLYLRTSSGLPLKKLRDHERKRLIEKAEGLVKEGLLCVEGDRLRIPIQHIPVMNRIIVELID